MSYNPTWSGGGGGTDEVGTIKAFGMAVPVGWLACDGSVIAQATYAALFAAIGTTFDTGGEGAGNFRLPDMRRRTAVGSGGAGTATLGNAVGDPGGTETHTLLTAEMPSHVHREQGVLSSGVASALSCSEDGSGGGFDSIERSTTASGGNTLTALNTVSAGGDGSHNNIQPSLVLNYGIKT